MTCKLVDTLEKVFVNDKGLSKIEARYDEEIVRNCPTCGGICELESTDDKGYRMLSPCPGRYALVSGLSSMNLVPVRESIRLLLEGNTEYEFRTTVVKELHREEDFPEMGEMIRGAKRYFLQSFTDRDTVPYEGFSAPSKEEMRRYADLVRPYVQEVGLRGVE